MENNSTATIRATPTGPNDHAPTGTRFKMKRSVQAQLKMFHDLRQSDPQRAADIHKHGEALVRLSSNGSYGKFKQYVTCEVPADEEVFTYYVVKAYKAALAGAHLMIAGYIIDEGYPFSKTGVPHVLLEVLASPEMTDERACDLIEFLIKRGLDVNLASQGTWLTLLHVCIRYSFLKSVFLCIQAGADVNAVADGDLMPLPMAQQLLVKINVAKEALNSAAQDNTDDEVVETDPAERQRLQLQKRETTRFAAIPVSHVNAIVKLLIAKGARMSWRRDTLPPPPPPTAKPVLRSCRGTVQLGTTPTVAATRLALQRGTGLVDVDDDEGELSVARRRLVTQRAAYDAEILAADSKDGGVGLKTSQPTPPRPEQTHYKEGDDGGQLFSTGGW